MKKYIKYLVFAAAVVLTTVSASAEPDQATQTIFKSLMTATVSNDYAGFIAVCDATMKAAISKPMLEGVSQQIAPRAKKGYEAKYLGELSQRGYKVYLWRLRFKDGSDDILATLSVKDGRASGFLLR